MLCLTCYLHLSSVFFHVVDFEGTGAIFSFLTGAGTEFFKTAKIHLVASLM